MNAAAEQVIHGDFLGKYLLNHAPPLGKDLSRRASVQIVVP
jgi:hypothetical protein